MSAHYLSHTFDIHGGGMDLIFPHHENEIAQSCAACPDSNINFWVHNGFVNVDDLKMSKSLGNFFTIREVKCEIAFVSFSPLSCFFFKYLVHHSSSLVAAAIVFQNLVLCVLQVTKLYHPLALRHFLLGMHYRSPVNYTISQIEQSSEAVFYIYKVKGIYNNVKSFFPI